MIYEFLGHKLGLCLCRAVALGAGKDSIAEVIEIFFNDYFK